MLDTVVWRSTATRLSVVPEDGLEVVCDGRMSTYAPRSLRYQLVVESMAVAGAGALLALLEERRRKLAAEGLFDDTRKRAIPFLPATIGIVTSPSGAAVRDILRVLADRFPRPVHVWPVRVQGEGAAAEVARAIAGFDGMDSGGAIPQPDVLIVARGGGQHRGSVGVQRRGRGARGGRVPPAADQRRGPRDRHHLDRPRG